METHDRSGCVTDTEGSWGERSFGHLYWFRWQLMAVLFCVYYSRHLASKCLVSWDVLLLADPDRKYLWVPMSWAPLTGREDGEEVPRPRGLDSVIPGV